MLTTLIENLLFYPGLQPRKIKLQELERVQNSEESCRNNLTDLSQQEFTVSYTSLEGEHNFLMESLNSKYYRTESRGNIR